MRKNENIISGIYCIENKINHKKYIGQSINVYDRWSKHKSELVHKKHENDYLQKSWNKYGEDNFEFYILEKCFTEELDEREIYWIDYHNSLNMDFGYNLKQGGQCGVISKESKRKQSESIKAFYTKEKIEEKRKLALKQWSDPNIKKKICGENNGMYGKTYSEETKLKISESHKGKISPKRNLNPVLCVELNKVFSCAVEAAKELNISNTILEVCYGNRKTCEVITGNFIRKIIYKSNKIEQCNSYQKVKENEYIRRNMVSKSVVILIWYF